MQNIILCGGSGTRLWPVSRTASPKQFVKLFDNKSLFQLTVERNMANCNKNIVVSNAEQYLLAEEQLEELSVSDSAYMIEPIGRNTAPAIALACFSLDPEEIVLVTPSDHLIKDQKAYAEVLTKAEEFAEEGFLVTFGITPDRAETGFGYIEADGNTVKNFHEKPDADKAQAYLEAGNYYWNSGMFCFKAGVFLAELKKYSPEMFIKAQEAFNNTNASRLMKIDLEDMLAIPKDSIDYAVMEKSDKVKVVPAAIKWSDVGSFDSLYAELPTDENGNTKSDDVITVGASNNMVLTSGRKVAFVDTEDLIVVDTPDALLVAKRGSSQKVKEVVDQLQGSDLTKVHNTASRPWGSYTILHDTDYYKTKRIDVKPGKRLSLQSHKKRDELWMIVAGKAKVTLDEQELLLSYGEKVEIKREQKHRVENVGTEMLTFIEIQTGDYFGEDDIIRYQDDFGR